MADSPRHRSSTLKPAKLPPARLNILPTPLPQSPRFLTPVTQFTPLSARPATSAASLTPTHDNAHSITPIPHAGGIRAHLAHLLPRHAAFTVILTLHQLHNVPLVHGEFGLKWKIKGVTSHSGHGLLDKVKARKAKCNFSERTQSTAGPGDPTPSLAKGSDSDDASLFDTSDAHSIANSSSTHSRSNDHVHSASGSPQGHGMRTRPVPIPAVIVSSNSTSPSPVTRSVSGVSITSMSSVSSVSSTSLHANGRLIHNSSGHLSAGWSRQGPTHVTETPCSPLSANDNTPRHPETPLKHHYSPAKGITPFVKLKDHSVVWEETLRFVVQMSVGRDNGELGDCLAKFVVMQRVVTGDPDAPRNPRLGAVYLNLAQYVDAGVITRRYLLRQSKTNATLKLSIHLEHTAGETVYVAPPLPKGEILSEVTGLLESSDIYRTRPRASDLYTHSSGSSSDGVGAVSGSDASSIISGSGASNGTQSHNHSNEDGQSRHATMKRQRRPFDVAKLPTISDPRGTEKLIEALFNPVPVTHPGKVTPFTYLVEVDEEVDAEGDVDIDAEVEHALQAPLRATIVCGDQETQRSTLDGEVDDGSLYADSPLASADEENGMGSDYHSLRSHPSFQGSLRSKRSTRSLANKAGLECDEGKGTAVSSGLQLLSGVTERRTWWQKVLRPPAAG